MKEKLNSQWSMKADITDNYMQYWYGVYDGNCVELNAQYKASMELTSWNQRMGGHVREGKRSVGHVGNFYGWLIN